MKRKPFMLRSMQSWKIALLCFDLGAGLYLGGKVTGDLKAPEDAAKTSERPEPLACAAPPPCSPRRGEPRAAPEHPGDR